MRDMELELKVEDLFDPKEMAAFVDNENALMGVWQHYRESVFIKLLASAVETAKISAVENERFKRFIGMPNPCFGSFFEA